MHLGLRIFWHLHWNTRKIFWERTSRYAVINYVVLWMNRVSSGRTNLQSPEVINNIWLTDLWAFENKTSRESPSCSRWLEKRVEVVSISVFEISNWRLWMSHDSCAHMWHIQHGTWKGYRRRRESTAPSLWTMSWSRSQRPTVHHTSAVCHSDETPPADIWLEEHLLTSENPHNICVFTHNPLQNVLFNYDSPR